MALNLFEFNSWKIHCDQDVNRSIYARIARGGPELCGCEDCLRFVPTRDSFYPDELKQLLGDLGIDYRKETEVVTYGTRGGPPSLLQGWYNLAGRVEKGEEDVFYVSGNFQLNISNGGLLPAPEFGSIPLVKFEWQWPTADLRTS